MCDRGSGEVVSIAAVLGLRSSLTGAYDSGRENRRHCDEKLLPGQIKRLFADLSRIGWCW